MAAVGTKYNLHSAASAKDPDGSAAVIAEILEETNEPLPFIPWKQSNREHGHTHTVRSGQPTPTWRKLNEGVARTVASQEQVTDVVGLMRDLVDIDAELLDMENDPAGLRMSETKSHVMGMNEEFMRVWMYGNHGTDEEQFDGLTTRYNTPSTSTTNNGYNIFNGGGTGTDNTSIWLLGFSMETLFGIYPKNTQAGLSIEDKGLEWVNDASGDPYEVKRTKLKWDCGLGLKDWRFAFRLCNIDVSNLAAQSSAANLIRFMIKMLNGRKQVAGINWQFWMNETTKSGLDIQLNEKSNAGLRYGELAGREVLFFRDVPVFKADAIVNNEAQVTGTFATR